MRCCPAGWEGRALLHLPQAVAGPACPLPSAVRLSPGAQTASCPAPAPSRADALLSQLVPTLSLRALSCLSSLLLSCRPWGP